MGIDVDLEKQKYVATVGISKETYQTDSSIELRLRRIFRTFARVLRGRGNLSAAEKEQEVTRLIGAIKEQVIFRILDSPIEVAGSQERFDQWHRQTILAVQNECPIHWDGGNRLTIGMCQKMINLPCKDIWALGLILEPSSAFYHPVIDAITLRYLLGLLERPWTKLESYEDYFRLQNELRRTSIAIGSYPMAVECENWNGNSQRKGG